MQKIMTRAKFSKLVENLLTVSFGQLTYLEAIMEICERNGIEPEIAKQFLSKPLMEKVQAEAQRSHLLKIPACNTLYHYE